MRRFHYPLFSCFIALSSLSFSYSAAAANAVIDVLVVYTQGVADLYGGDPTTRFNQLFQVSNQIYKDSNVNVEIRLAKAVKVAYTDDNNAGTALNDLTFGSNAAFTNIANLRAQAKADMVVFYRPYKASHGSCGIAWIGGNGTSGDFSNPQIKNYMYAHVGITSCGDYVTAHEMGHNMGLKHSRKQDGSGGTFPYALGYGVDNKFTTIMAYQSSFNVDYWSGKLYKFSNPEIACQGLPCGVDRNNTTAGADARYALNITAPQISKFYDAPSSSSVSSASLASSKASVVSSAASSKPVSSVASSSAKSSVASSSVKSSAASSIAKSSAASSAKATSSTSSSKAAVIAYKLVANVAQYNGADWKNKVRVGYGLTLDQAKAIATADPTITYFFYTKGYQMVLGDKGVYHYGDTVFFSGKPWYGSAPGLADAYEK